MVPNHQSAMIFMDIWLLISYQSTYPTFKPSMAEMVPVAEARNWLLLLWLPSG